jgi:hypothetical protein
MELPEMFELTDRGIDPEEWAEAEDGSGLWDETVNAVLVFGRELQEARAAARDMRISKRALEDPARVAAEMKRRSDYLRSRPMRAGFHQRELTMLSELDVIEARARALELQRHRGSISATQAAGEMEELGLAVFAVRGRYADLLAAMGEPWPSRPKHDPEARKRELEEIEAFLAKKREREAA